MMVRKHSILFLTLVVLVVCACTKRPGKGELGAGNTLPPATTTNVPSDETPILNSDDGPVKAPVPAFSVIAEAPPEIVTYSGTSN